MWPGKNTVRFGARADSHPSMFSLLLMTFMQIPPPAPVQEPSRIEWRRRTLIRFGEVEVLGKVTGPSGAYVRARRAAQFRCLVRVRRDFNPELAASVDNL